jgi:hypothetical protein
METSNRKLQIVANAVEIASACRSLINDDVTPDVLALLQERAIILAGKFKTPSAIASELLREMRAGKRVRRRRSSAQFGLGNNEADRLEPVRPIPTQTGDTAG